MTIIWTKKEKDELMNLALRGDLKNEEIVFLLNDKFNTKRSQNAIAIQKHNLLKEKKQEGIKMVKSKRKIVKVRNGRKAWTTADDRYLINNWSSDGQSAVAEHLGRTEKACASRHTKVRKHMPEYHSSLVGADTITVLPAKVEQYSLLDKLYVMLKYRKESRTEKKKSKAEAKASKKRAKLEKKIAKLRGKL